MQLVHFSPEPVTMPRTVLQDDENLHHFKPRGFWVSDEGGDEPWGWSHWSRSEQFRLDHFKYAYEIELSAQANILWIRTPEEIDTFTAEYKAPLYPGDKSGIGIDWERVAARYDGIIITPYQWSRRFTHGASWYYAWDCASGCIWNGNAITKLTSIAPPDMSPEREEAAE